jgi:hypothetical protein
MSYGNSLAHLSQYTKQASPKMRLARPQIGIEASDHGMAGYHRETLASIPEHAPLQRL